MLVTDDDPGVRQVVSYLLAEFGFECHTAEDGASDLGRFDEGGWDLVVTDLAMPKMNGWQVIEAIRKRTRRRSSSWSRHTQLQRSCGVPANMGCGWWRSPSR